MARKLVSIQKILKQIEEIWKDSPDQRFGQLLINLGIADDSVRLWQNEDSGLEQWLQEHIKKMKGGLLTNS